MGCISSLLPKLPGQCYSNGQGNFGSKKEIQLWLQNYVQCIVCSMEIMQFMILRSGVRLLCSSKKHVIGCFL